MELCIFRFLPNYYVKYNISINVFSHVTDEVFLVLYSLFVENFKTKVNYSSMRNI